MAFAWACCLAVFLREIDLLLDWVGMEDTQLMMGVLFEVALRVVVAVEVAPAEVNAEAIVAVAVAAAVAADTEKIVARVEMGLPEMVVLVVEPPGTCLAVGVFDIVDQKVNTDSGGSGAWLVDWAKGWIACNKKVVEWLGSHLVLELERVVLPAAAEGEFDEAGQELTVGCLHQMHYQFFLDPW